MALKVVSPKCKSMAHLGLLERGSCQVLKGNVIRVPFNQKNVGKSSSLSIRCWKGQVHPPPEVLEHIINDGGVTPSGIHKPIVVTRKDFPVDFKFGCSTSALQVPLALSLSMSHAYK